MNAAAEEEKAEAEAEPEPETTLGNPGKPANWRQFIF